MRRLARSLSVVLLLLSIPTIASARGNLSGYVQQGGRVTGAVSATGILVPGGTGTSSVSLGRMYPGATVSVFLPGTATVVPLFKSDGSTLTDPFTADSTAAWSFYAADGTYDVKFSGGGIAVPWTLSNQTIGGSGGGSGVACSNASTDAATINAATAAVAAGGGTVTISSGVCAVNVDLTIPSNVTLAVARGALLKPAQGKTIHINGPLTAGPYQIFDVTGSTLAGTVTVTNGSTTLAGSGTTFTALPAGTAIYIGTGTTRFVGTIDLNGPTNDTTIKLSAPWPGATQAGVTATVPGLIMFGSALNQWASSSVTNTYPEWWGVVGNTGNYDTAAVQSAINSHIPVLFTKSYYVTAVATGYNNNLYIDGQSYVLFGVSTFIGTDTAFQVTGGYNNFHAINIDLQSDTTGKYLSAMHVFGDSTHALNPEYNNFYDFYIINAKIGLVLGAHVTYTTNTSGGASPYTPATPFNTPLSETLFYGLRITNTERCITANQPNGKVAFVGATLVAGGAAWTASTTYAVLNVPADTSPMVGGAELSFMGGTMVANAASGNIGIRGANMHIHSMIWEVTGNYGVIEGDNVVIEDTLDAGGIASNIPAFIIATTIPFGSGSAVKGRLRMTNCTWDNSSDSGVFADTNTVSLTPAFNANFTVYLTDTTISGWAWNTTNQNSPIVKGCYGIFKGLRFKTHAGATDFVTVDNTQPFTFIGADPVGNSMSAALDITSPKGGWYIGAVAGTQTYSGYTTAPLPPGLAGSIRLSATGASASVNIAPLATPASSIATNSILVMGGQVRVLEGFIIGTGNGQLALQANFYQWNGAASATATINNINFTPVNVDLTSWRRFSQYVVVPPDAAYAQINLHVDSASGTTVGQFAGLRF